MGKTIAATKSRLIRDATTAGNALLTAANVAAQVSLLGVYTTSQVDSIIAGLTALEAEDIDTLAEINAILTDANVASVSYVDGLATNYATAAQGATADTALQPADITSGTITAGTADIDLSSGTTGFVLTQQGDGSFAMSAAAGGVAGPVSSTDSAIAIWDGTGGDTLQDSPLTYTSDILLDQRNGVNGQKYRIAKTYTSATSFEAFEIDSQSDADNFLLTSLRGSSGGTQRGVKIGTRQDGGAFSTILTINADKTAMLGENTVQSAELRMSHSGGVGGGTLRGIQRGIEVRSQSNSTDLSGGYSSATIDLSGVKVRASGFYRFVSGNDSYQDAADLCLGRDAAGQLGVYTSESKATRGSLILGSLGVWGTTPPASQPSAIADVPTAGSATAADNASAINSILAALRGYGVIAT